MASKCNIQDLEVNRKTVFNCSELINIIYQQLSNSTDKINFMLTCKSFRNSIQQKCLFQQESLLNRSSLVKNHFLIQYTKFTLHCDFLEICPSPLEHHDNNIIAIINKKIRNNTKNIDKLYINPDHDNWDLVIRKFNAFDNIKFLKIAWTIPPIKLTFFKHLDTLKPTTIFLDYQENAHSEIDVETDEKWSFPLSMENLIIRCKGSTWIDVLLNGLANFKINKLKVLEIIHLTSFMFNFSQHWSKFFELIDYFNKINIIFDFVSLGQEFYNFVDHISFNDRNSKLDLNLKVSIKSSFWRKISYRVCLKIKLLCILNVIERYEEQKMDENYVNQIYDTLLQMQKLQTLMFRFTITDLGVNFERFICYITKNLKHIQITDCKKMSLLDLQTIAENLKNLEALSLYGIESNDITLEEVLNLFPSVKVLEIFFKKPFKNTNIPEFLRGKKLGNGDYKFLWPKAICLNIFTYYPTNEEIDKLFDFEKRIPRKSGQLTFGLDKLYFEPDTETDIFRITLQKYSGCYNYLRIFRNNIFKISSKIRLYEDLLFQI